MTIHKPVPLDTVKQIIQLSKGGMGSNQIGAETGINSSTVKLIIAGSYRLYSNKLSNRERGQLMSTWLAA
jgi:DNA-binding NarL/FixJ family response regulator